MTIGEMDPNFTKRWNGQPDYEDAVVMVFEIQTDMDLVLGFIRDSCLCQDINGKVTIIDGTLKTEYSYEHDGT